MDKKGNLKRPKGVVIAVLNVFGMDRNMIRPHEIHLRKVGATGRGGRSLVCVRLGIGRG